MNHADSTGSLIGRVLLSLIFLLSGFHKIAAFEQTQQYMLANGMTATGLFAIGAIAVEVGAGACLLLGYFGRYAAALLAAFLVPVTLIFHDFWTLTGMEQQNQMIQFLKNIAIMGGLVYVASVGSREYSLDARLRKGSEMPTYERARPIHGHQGPSRA